MPETQDFKKASASAQDISGNFKMYPCMYYLHVCPCMCAIWSPPQAPSIFVVGRCGLCTFNTWRILLSSLLSLSLSLHRPLHEFSRVLLLNMQWQGIKKNSLTKYISALLYLRDLQATSVHVLVMCLSVQDGNYIHAFTLKSKFI